MKIDKETLIFLCPNFLTIFISLICEIDLFLSILVTIISVAGKTFYTIWIQGTLSSIYKINYLIIS